MLNGRGLKRFSNQGQTHPAKRRNIYLPSKRQPQGEGNWVNPHI
jgi:hypothetical protein